MRQHRGLHPITQASFSEWKQNIITKQLFEDLEVGVLNGLDSINPILNPEKAAIGYTNLYAVREVSDIIINWAPEFLEKVDDKD